MRVRVRDDPDYEIKVGGVVPDPAIFKDLNCYQYIINIHFLHDVYDFRTTEFSEYADFTEWITAQSMRQ